MILNLLILGGGMGISYGDENKKLNYKNIIKQLKNF